MLDLSPLDWPFLTVYSEFRLQPWLPNLSHRPTAFNSSGTSLLDRSSPINEPLVLVGDFSDPAPVSTIVFGSRVSSLQTLTPKEF